MSDRENNLAAVAKLMQDSCRVSINLRPSQRYEAKMRVRVKGGTVMGLCNTLWPATFYPEKRRKMHKGTMYVWEATGKKAYTACCDIWPYLAGAQQVRAICLKEFYEDCFLARELEAGFRRALTLEEMKLRESFRQRMIFITKMQEMENSK